MKSTESLSVYVSPEGNDAWSGRVEKPNGKRTEGPVASLEAARDTVRRLKREGGVPAGGITVWIAPGTYTRERTFELTPEDSGAPYAPVRYRGSPGSATRLIGGRRITEFRPVSDPSVLERFEPAARAHVLEADLRAAGVTDFGQMRSRGFGRPVVPAGLELFLDGRPMKLARWPNVDFVTISAIPRTGTEDDGWGGAVGKIEQGFHFHGERIRGWKASDDIWVHGYWCWDWANTYERVASLDPETGLIRTADPYGCYGFKAGQRFYFVNILEELDEPGEWYVDRERGILYFWPPYPLEGAEAFVSVMEEPLVKLADASHVWLENLSVECTRGVGIEVVGGTGNVIGGCRLRDIGAYGATIRGGFGHTVAGCDVEEVGDGGIHLIGGDRKTLTPCGHVVDNCRIRRYGRWSRCYRPGILADGVGMRFTHNRLSDAPHTAILFSGNEFLIEYNEIHSVCMETGDAGAIYTGRDYTFRGNVIRHNFIHHMGGVGMGTMAVYNDDCVSGTAMIGNVFYRVTRAAMLGGGRDFRVENNLFVDCEPAIAFDSRGISPHAIWQRMVYTTMKERLEAMDYLKAPYVTRYPELRDLERYYAGAQGVPPENCVIDRNVCSGGTWMVADDGARQHLVERRNLISRTGLRFVKPERLDFRPWDPAALARVGFEPIPMQRIGLCRDSCRRTVPPRRVVHLAAKVLSQGTPSPDGNGRPARIAVTVENRGGVTEAGAVGLQSVPGAAMTVRWVKGPAYRLAPGQSIELAAEVTFGVGVTVLPVGVYLEGEDFLRRQLELRIRGTWAVPRLTAGATLEAVRALMAVAPAKVVCFGREAAADLWLAWDGKQVAFGARVRDARVERAMPAWTGSCVELFGARSGRGRIGQVFLLPAAGGEPAAAFIRDTGPADGGIRVESAAIPGGYEIRALVPGDRLGLAPGIRRFLFEIQVTAAGAADGAYERATLFGSSQAYAKTERYAEVLTA